MKCNNCGKIISNDMLFCPYCGSKQESKDTEKKSVKSKSTPQKNVAVIKSLSSQTESNGIDDAFREFAIKVLNYMKRSKSEKQITIYTNKYAQTVQYCKQNNIDSEFTPFIFAEALRMLEQDKSTTIHHIEADEIAMCIAENKDEFVIGTRRAQKKEPNSSIGKVFLWGIIIVLFLMLKMCGGCEGCSDDSDIPEQKPTTFTKTCRNCGRTFETHHEEDMTCSTECYRAWERQKAAFKKYGY